MKSVRFAVLALATVLAGCGSVGDLEPPPGQPLPVKPAMAQRTPTPEELLTPPPFAKPERIDELMRRSQPREADRFDLPPPDGGPAPVRGDEEPAEEEVRVSNPQ